MYRNKILKNSAISVIAQIISLLLQFVNRRIFIIFLDIEFLGYQTLFNNVFSLLSIAELGIGNIICFHLYREIVNENKDEISKLMQIYKWMYRMVAGIVLFAGLACCYLLPYFVTDAKVSWNYLYKIYFLQLGSVFLGYFLSYRRTIYIADQKEYKCAEIDCLSNIVIQFLQLIVLALTKNYLLYLCIQLSRTILANIVISFMVKKDYPYLSNKCKITRYDISSRKLIPDTKNFLVHKIAYAVYGGTDNIIISAFCGVRYVALFGNYTLIQNGVVQLLFYKLLNPIQATIGNIVYSNRDKEQLWDQFKMLTVFSFFFASYIGVGFMVLFQPFIELWMGSEYLLQLSFVGIFSVLMYLQAAFEIVYKYRSVFGDYSKDRNCMVLSAVLNIAVSVPGAKIFGISGVLIGTLVAYLPICCGRIRFVVCGFFEKKISTFLIRQVLYFVVFIVEDCLCYMISRLFSTSVLGLIERGIIILVIPTIMNSAFLYRDPAFGQFINYILHLIKRK